MTLGLLAIPISVFGVPGVIRDLQRRLETLIVGLVEANEIIPLTKRKKNTVKPATLAIQSLVKVLDIATTAVG